MKVLFAITRAERGGAQIHVLDLIRSFHTRHQVVLVCGEHGFLAEEAEALGVRTVVMPSLVRQISPFRDILAIRDFGKILTQERPDVVHLHSSKAGFVGRIAGRLTSVPVVFTAHGWGFTKGIPAVQRTVALAMERATASLASRIIAVSDYDRLLAIESQVGPPRRLVTIRNGAPDVKPRPSPSDHSNKPVNIVMVARFSAQKDHHLLLEAVSEIDCPFKLTLVGDGPSLGEVKQQAVSMGIKDRVSFLGSRADVPDILANSDLFVLASRWEGLPISIIEAMRAGLPSVASNVGGVSELIENGSTGLLVPPRDATALRSAIQKYCEDANLRVAAGRAARTRYLQFFSLGVMVESIERLYEDVIAEWGEMYPATHLEAV